VTLARVMTYSTAASGSVAGSGGSVSGRFLPRGCPSTRAPRGIIHTLDTNLARGMRFPRHRPRTSRGLTASQPRSFTRCFAKSSVLNVLGPLLTRIPPFHMMAHTRLWIFMLPGTAKVTPVDEERPAGYRCVGVATSRSAPGSARPSWPVARLPATESSRRGGLWRLASGLMPWSFIETIG